MASQEDASKSKIPIYMAIDSDPIGSCSPGPVYKPPPVAPERSGCTFGIGERLMYTQRRTSAVAPKVYGISPRPLPSAFHGQPDSRKSTAPAPSFAGRGRAYSSLKIAAPGDTAAPSWGSRKAHVDSRHPMSASFGFSKGERFVDHSGSLAAAAYSLPPPPGKYEVQMSIGPQASSDKPTRPASAFARAPRDPPSEENLGYKKPGPGDHTPRLNDAIGEQVLSRRRHDGGFGFGSSQRFEKVKDLTESPGPGSYVP